LLVRGGSDNPFSGTYFDAAIDAHNRRSWHLPSMPGSLESGFFVSPLDYHRDAVVPVFRKRDGIDRFGREQTTGPPDRHLTGGLPAKRILLRKAALCGDHTVQHAWCAADNR